MGSAGVRFRRHYGGDAFRLVMAENMAPWLRAFSTSRWKIEGDREKFADAWHRWVEGHFPAEGMLHLSQPPSVSPVQPAAPASAVANAVPKAAPKPPPQKGLRQQYGSCSNIRVVLQHFRRQLATEQHGIGELNACPWSELEGASRCTWRAGQHLKPSRRQPKNFSDHLSKDHGSDPAQCEQAEAMIKGVMPRGLAGPFVVARAGSKALALPAGVHHSGLQEATSSATLSSARGSASVSHSGATWCPVGRARRHPPEGVAGTGRRPVWRRGRCARRPNQVLAALLVQANRFRPRIRVRRRCHEEIPPLTPRLQCLGTSKARCGVTACPRPRARSTVWRLRRAL